MIGIFCYWYILQVWYLRPNWQTMKTVDFSREVWISTLNRYTVWPCLNQTPFGRKSWFNIQRSEIDFNWYLSVWGWIIHCTIYAGFTGKVFYCNSVLGFFKILGFHRRTQNEDWLSHTWSLLSKLNKFFKKVLFSERFYLPKRNWGIPSGYYYYLCTMLLSKLNCEKIGELWCYVI